MVAYFYEVIPEPGADPLKINVIMDNKRIAQAELISQFPHAPKITFITAFDMVICPSEWEWDDEDDPDEWDDDEDDEDDDPDGDPVPVGPGGSAYELDKYN